MPKQKKVPTLPSPGLLALLLHHPKLLDALEHIAAGRVQKYELSLEFRVPVHSKAARAKIAKRVLSSSGRHPFD